MVGYGDNSVFFTCTLAPDFALMRVMLPEHFPITFPITSFLISAVCWCMPEEKD